jgi:hypothetical protein
MIKKDKQFKYSLFLAVKPSLKRSNRPKNTETTQART